PTSMEYCNALMAYLIDFDDNPNDKEIDRRIDTIKALYDIDGVMDAAGYCADCIGVTGTMEAVSKLLLVITCVVVILVTILMERSFISDETSQIALLKAIGFNDKTILKWHIIRFMLVGIVAELLAVLLTVPVTKLWCDPIFGMMGATDVKYFFNPVSLLICYPGIILIITFASVALTALYTKKISSRDVINIE
ncbi:MAG: FtsX-like permease family protein, partial [Wujia sp.]